VGATLEPRQSLSGEELSKIASVVDRHTLHSGVSQRAHQNRLLSSLPDEEFERLRPHLAPNALQYKCPLYEANEPIKFVHFIETGVASLVNTMMNGDAAEVGTIGNEGFVGIPVLFGDKQAPTRVYMQVGGASLKMKADLFRAEMERNAYLQKTMLHYAHAFFNQVAQSAACNTFHLLEQRCCRWLLMTQDRMQSCEFPLTQEFLAMMLGVRRAGVTDAASALKRAGLISYARGCVTVLDRTGLEKRSCECYGVTKREFDQLLGFVSASVSRSSEPPARDSLLKSLRQT
jgi:CRP-like cAMP-binding protein